MPKLDRRRFLRLSGLSLGAGALYRAFPALAAGGEAGETARRLAQANGEAPRPFSFVQLSDTHVGFKGPPNPTGTRAFERAVEVVNALDPLPELVLFTGDLTHDTEKPGEHAERMKAFRAIAGRLRVPMVKMVPGEHDAGLDGGALFREHFGETSQAFDHRGVHFVGLDNVSLAHPEVGAERIAWLRRDLTRFPRTAPIVVFTHRPIFDLRPDWEWFTSDGDAVMNVLAPFENVTVLYGHIHREDDRRQGKARHLAARSLCFAFPDPEKTADKAPVPFSPDHPFKNLGIRVVRGGAGGLDLGASDVELALAERSGTEGLAQLLRPSSL
jgi:3',5'-cyclic AMP phosphodiesterase CpdA